MPTSERSNEQTQIGLERDLGCASSRHAVPLVHHSHVPAERLHPLEGLATVGAHEVLALGVDGLVPVQRARGDEGLSADVASVGPLARVRPDVRGQVRAVAEALLAHGAAVGLVFGLVALAVLVVVVVVVAVVVEVVVEDAAVDGRVEGQLRFLQAAPQTGRGRDEVFHVRLEVVQLLGVLVLFRLRLLVHPEVPVAPLLLLLLHRVVLLHPAAALLLPSLVSLTMLGLSGERLMLRWGWLVMGVEVMLLQPGFQASFQAGSWIVTQIQQVNHVVRLKHSNDASRSGSCFKYPPDLRSCSCILSRPISKSLERQISSLYSAIVFSTASNISSAAAASLSLKKIRSECMFGRFTRTVRRLRLRFETCSCETEYVTLGL